jgi:DNA methylase
MACGEMTEVQFEGFLRTSLGLAAAHSQDGSVQFVCMHWSKMKETLLATTNLYSELKNLCIWNKTNAGMGSLYRSKHELIFVFKKGSGAHINNIELGRFGRNRTNVWDYPGQNIFNGSSKSKLSLHPTAKPVALVADAIRDCSHREGIVLDPFGGVGSTLIAAEKTGRRARLIELDPRYVDATVKRWEALTGAKAVEVDHDATAPEADRSVDSDGAVIREADKAKAGGSTAEGYARGGEVGTSFTDPSPHPSNEGSA